MHKIFAAILVSSALVLSLSSCSSVKSSQPVQTTNSADAASASSKVQKEFTVDELKTFNGKNGHPAYIAVDGNVYDVTNVPSWSGGIHQGYRAGQDLTDPIKNNSPHGVSKLKGIPIVGVLKK
jgi:predicted heme/steroid binding protein